MDERRVSKTEAGVVGRVLMVVVFARDGPRWSYWCVGVGTR